ncbi:MAG: hypothetical protein QW231_00830 [Candidatus Bathyarchaeia archaeon]
MGKEVVAGAAGHVNDQMQLCIEGLDIEVVKGNLLDPNLAPKLVADVDAVIHTANLVSLLPGMSESEIFDSNVRGHGCVYALESPDAVATLLIK